MPAANPASTRRSKAYRTVEHPRTLSLITVATRLEAEAIRRGFVATDRFDIDDLDAKNLPDRLDVVRPVDFLASFRCDPRPVADGSKARVLTARDHVVLELLVTAAKAEHPALESRMCAVDLSSILAVLGAGTRWREVEDSLRRLSTVECTLPGLPPSRMRMSSRRRYAAENVEQDGGRDITISDRQDVYALREAGRRRESAGKGLTTGGWVQAVPRRDGKVLPRTPIENTIWGDLAAIGTDEPEPDWDASEAILRRFRPVVRFMLRDGIIFLELARYMRAWLSAHRRTGRTWAPWLPIDVRQMSRFSSSYSAPLYRILMSRTFDHDIRAVRLGETTVRIKLADLPALIGYKPQKLGLLSQIWKAVVLPTDKDFAGMGGRVTISPAGVIADSLVWTVTQPVDHYRMRSAVQWRTPTGDMETIRLHYRSRQLADLRADDCLRWTVPPRWWLAVAGRLKLDRDATANMLRAWLHAVDEAIHHEDASYGRLTDRVAGRMRGKALLDRAKADDLLGALHLFAEQEVRDPDLTRQDVLDTLTLDGTYAVIQHDREVRARKGKAFEYMERRPRQLVDEESYAALRANRAGREWEEQREIEYAKAVRAWKRRVQRANARPDLRPRVFDVGFETPVDDLDLDCVFYVTRNGLEDPAPLDLPATLAEIRAAGEPCETVEDVTNYLGDRFLLPMRTQLCVLETTDV